MASETTAQTLPKLSDGQTDLQSVAADNKDVLSDAVNNFIQGKRAILLSDYSSAAHNLEKACELFDSVYGIGADECGEAYFFYGLAMLELARVETGALNGVVNTFGTESESESEEEENGDDDDEDNNESGEENGKEQESEKVEDEAGKKTDTEEDIEYSDEDKGLQNNKPAALPEQPFTDQPGPSKPVEEEETAGDTEASSLEIAWELLQLARDVFKRQTSDTNSNMKLRLAETLQKLGEVSLEWENPDKAVDFFHQSLSLRKECLAEDDRLIAETYYHIGLAFSFNNEYEKANDCFKSAIDVIENRIANKKKIIAESSADEAALEDVKKEIDELDDLLPEMKSKIEDSQDQMQNAREALQQADDEKLQEEAAAAKKREVEVKPANNISHLIKRKRTESGIDGNDSKKMCTSKQEDEKKST